MQSTFRIALSVLERGCEDGEKPLVVISLSQGNGVETSVEVKVSIEFNFQI